jgi:hypothetical protein
MRYLRARASPDLDAAPETFRVLADSEHVQVARAVATKFAGGAGLTGLFHVEGDRVAVAERLETPPEVVTAETVPAPGGGFYLLAVLDPESVPLMRALFEVLAWRELVVVPPVVYRGGTVRARIVGTTGTVGDLVEALPEAVDVEVEAVGERGVGAAPAAAALSDRQRDAVEAALALGYYDQPRAATHEDVAAAIDCAASTASEHLRKAEAKLVRAAIPLDE